MAWTEFSAEAVLLDSQLRQLHKEGRTTEAIIAIEAALANAHRNGPSNMSYEEFERASSSDHRSDSAGKSRPADFEKVG